MTTLRADHSANTTDSVGPNVRIVFRDGTGAIHFDWPVERLPDAIDDREGTLWVDIEEQCGDANGKAEALLRDVFHFHPLAIEDALKEKHLPKVDDWGAYLYVVFHTIEFDPVTDGLRLHELDIFLGPNYVVTYHIEPMPILSELSRNIQRDPTNRLRHGADHLLYHILDLSVAEYLPAIEHLEEAIDAAQDEVFGRPTTHTVQAIFQVKRASLRLHRVLSPQRELLNRLARDDYDPIAADHRVYFRDVYDHIVRVHDIAESLRDLISGALDTYLSAISNRTNDIMKALTIVTVMFLPISFVTSFWGMNFFGERLAFQVAWPRAGLFWASCVLMVVPSVVMWIWAKRKGWF
ncbi:MAG: magnesium/cobalt transporter CorA [Isosphaeraceae bacterium]|nr:magnesium/cobalt transporter CorA [Isosphaeraceae bacterium]